MSVAAFSADLLRPPLTGFPLPPPSHGTGLSTRGRRSHPADTAGTTFCFRFWLSHVRLPPMPAYELAAALSDSAPCGDQWVWGASGRVGLVHVFGHTRAPLRFGFLVDNVFLVLHSHFQDPH